MNPILKTTQVYIENQPSQWMLYEGKSSFGADPYAYTDSEEKANHLVRACNSFEAMRAALEGIVAFLSVQRTLAPSKRGPLDEQALLAAQHALTLADGKDHNP